MEANNQWLEGYYPPEMDSFLGWCALWSMGPHADDNWVWFNGDYYTEEQARKVLAEKPDGTKADEPQHNQSAVTAADKGE